LLCLSLSGYWIYSDGQGDGEMQDARDQITNNQICVHFYLSHSIVFYSIHVTLSFVVQLNISSFAVFQLKFTSFLVLFNSF